MSTKRYVYCIISPIPPNYLAESGKPAQQINFVKFGDTNEADERPGYTTHNPNYTYFSNDTRGGPSHNVGTVLKKLVFQDRNFTTVNNNEWGVIYNDSMKLFEFATSGIFDQYDLTTDLGVQNAARDLISNWIPNSSRGPA